MLDKYAGTSQELTNKAVLVNDNKIHTIHVSRQSTGTVSVTVDRVVAQVNWLQSHDIMGQSVSTLYLAGLPLRRKIENSINIPSIILLYFPAIYKLIFRFLWVFVGPSV